MSRPLPEPVSLGDIARVAGVSRMTVSCALRNQPGVGAATRRRILQIARKLGYTPDARAASRMSEVRLAKAKELVPLAWINTDENEKTWHQEKYLKPYYDGACSRSRELGYDLQEFWLKQPGMTMRRLSTILYHRGIQGVIIAPPTQASLIHFRLDWRHFAAVSFQKALARPSLFRVTPDYYQNILTALRTLQHHRYRRIGVVLPIQSDRRSHHAYTAALSYFYDQVSQLERIPPIHGLDECGPARFRQWMIKHRPDVVVSQRRDLIEFIEKAGFKVPDQVGAVHLAMEDDCTDWAGIWAHKREIGMATAELVISLVQNRQFGLPSVPRDITIPGVWRPGRTLLIPKPGKS